MGSGSCRLGAPCSCGDGNAAGAEAETWLQRAPDVARRQGEIARATGRRELCRLWQQQGKQAEARALLAPLYAWFTEGFDTADLQEAKALLEALT